MGNQRIVELTADPATPAAGYMVVYAKTDGGLYARDDGGNVLPLAGGAAAPPVASLSAQGGVVTNGSVSFSNASGLTFGLNGSTMTANLPRVAMYENMAGNETFANAAATNSAAPNVSFQRISVPYQMDATRLDYLGHLTINGSTNYSSTMRVALYTMNGSTAGTVSTASQSASGNNAGYTNESGTRWRSVALGTWALTPGEYAIAFAHSLNGPSGTTGSMSLFGESNIPMLPNPGGAAVTDYFAEGILLAASSSPPASIHLSNVNGSDANAGAQPYFRLVGTF